MALVRIRLGSHSAVVTAGAYREIFKPQGWTIEGDEKPTPKIVEDKPDEVTSTQDESDANLDTENEPEDDDEADGETESDENDDEDDSEDDSDEDESDEDLEEKPLSEMSFSELSAYAKKLKIDIKGLNSKKLLRQAIREHIS